MSKSVWNAFPAEQPELEILVVVFVLQPQQRLAFARLGGDGKFREINGGIVGPVTHWVALPDN